jgi:hypothetical protein
VANVSKINFSYEEVVTLFIKALGLHEGLWCLGMQFNFQTKNVRHNANDPKVVLGFLGTIDAMSITRVDKVIPGITVDAAKVNPPPKPSRKSLN